MYPSWFLVSSEVSLSMDIILLRLGSWRAWLRGSDSSEAGAGVSPAPCNSNSVLSMTCYRTVGRVRFAHQSVADTPPVSDSHTTAMVAVLMFLTFYLPSLEALDTLRARNPFDSWLPGPLSLARTAALWLTVLESLSCILKQ